MAEGAFDVLSTVESERQKLEANIAKLRKSLRHWQTWEAEYEGLREELGGLQGPSNTEDMLKTGLDFGGELVNEKEMKELLGLDKGVSRSKQQVIDVIGRRVDYVQKYAQTVNKQLEQAESTLDSLVDISSVMRNEEGLPLRDIHEDLDEEGKVISSTISDPSKDVPAAVESLDKAGIEIPKEAPESVVKAAQKGGPEPASMPDPPSQGQMQSIGPASKNQAERAPAADIPKTTKRKKSVSFAADTKPESTEKTKQEGVSIGLDTANKFTSGSRVVELNDNDEIINSVPVNPTSDSAEDARLRREMMDYALNEVGPIVAELNLQDGSDDDYADYDDDFSDEDMLDDDDSEENEYGMSTRSQITDEYRQQMEELDRKLNGPTSSIFGKKADPNFLDNVGEAKKLVIREGKPDNSDATPPTAAVKKGVRFADTRNDASPVEKVKPSTISDAVVERAPSQPSATTEQSAPRKQSRFKKDRGAASQPSLKPAAGESPSPFWPAGIPSDHSLPPHHPEPPQGRTHAEEILERPNRAREALPPNELDPALLYQEANNKYHEQRNRVIQQQGGFKATEEEETNPLMEERDGKIRKVSRFRAARMNAGGL